MPSAAITEESEQVAIRIGYDELPVSCLRSMRNDDVQACPLNAFMQCIDVGHLDLQVHPPAEGVLQGSLVKAPSGPAASSSMR